MQRILRGTLAGLLCGAALGGSAGAQEDGDTFLGTIVLLGERVARTLDQTLQGVSVLPGDAPDVAQPGAQINTVVPRTPNAFVQGPSELPSIRGTQGGGAGGLNSAAITGAPTRLPVIIDGVTRIPSLVNSAFTSLWDVQQIEVLRGPQSLLRGRAGIAGVVVVETNRPTDTFEAAIQAGIASSAVNGPQYVLNGMVSGPVGPNMRARLSFEHLRGDDPREVLGAGGDWITEYSTLRLRGQLEGSVDLGFGGVTDWALIAEGQTGFVPQTRNFIDDPALTGRPFADRTILATSATRAFDINATVLAFKTGTDIGAGRLETVLSWGRDRFDSRGEQTFPSRLGADERLLNLDVLYRFGAEGDPAAGQLNGIVGLAFERRKQAFDATGAPLLASIDVRARSAAIYADLRYGLGARTTLSFGARLQRYSDTRDIVTTVLFPPPFPPVAGADSSATDQTILLPSIGIGHRLDDRNTLGLSLRRGFTPGGAAINAFTGVPYSYDSESMWTAEATWRHESADGTLRIGLTAFYNRLDAPQVYGATVPGNRLSLQVFNQQEGESWGIEAEGDWQATDALRIDAALGLLTTRITRAAAATPAVQGNRFGQDPRATLSLGAVWTPAPDWQIDGRITYVGKTFNDFNNLPEEEVGGYTIVDLGISRFFGAAELRAYVTNLTDSAGQTRIVTGAGADLVAPRTVGLTLTRRF